MLFETVKKYAPPDFIFKIAQTHEDLEGFWALRRQVFCKEQEIFHESDHDEYDDKMIPIVCKSLLAGMEDLVVGVVRIDEREPGIWYGSRLAVHKDYRKLLSISSGVSIRNCQPNYRGLGALGAGLIYKAVSTANRIGCKRFFATVQHQNEKFFRRFHWRTIDNVDFRGIRHAYMEADLNYYQPAEFIF
ncbi:MAG: MSMEG_0567/Sll0786 family nitrogen starvation N-acetyltransferase [Verrucomicrobiota bacterium]